MVWTFVTSWPVTNRLHGEGGLSRHHLEPGGDVTWQIGTGYCGCQTRSRWDPARREGDRGDRIGAPGPGGRRRVLTDIFPDFIVVVGAEGGTGAAPLEFSDSLGAPLVDGLMFVQSVLVENPVCSRVSNRR